jgi:hypothetical protein
MKTERKPTSSSKHTWWMEPLALSVSLALPHTHPTHCQQATGAHYNFGVNCGGGMRHISSEGSISLTTAAIIGMDLVGPRYAVTERDNWNREAKPDELPKLRYISDIFWGFYLRSNPNPKNLRYYIATHVLNDATVTLVARALSNVGAKDLSEWPGNSFELGSEEMAALVGEY